MSNRKQRVEIAKETLAILERGNYHNRLNEIVDLSAEITFSKCHSIHYLEDSFPQVIAERNLLSQQLPANSTEFSVINETTLCAAHRLVRGDGIEKVLCLNFASAMSPGGGFLNGSQAQEESLARATALYPCLAQMNQMYDINRQFGSELFTDNMIYSPRVSVFRDDEDLLLDQHFNVSILTAPAVRANRITIPEEIEQIPKVMLNRIEKLLSIAAIHNYSTLVLGAWGCGVFGNQPEQVAKDFYYHLVQNPHLNRFFKKVVFAVLDNTTEESNINPFRQVFCTK